jgi:uncharacterized RDD family membrane protein YckC
MTQIPAGWYPDPDPEQPEPKGQRYWDGQQWTEHVQPAPGQPLPAAPYGGGYGQGGYGSAPYAGVQVGRATTPDGEELSGWWRRLVAYLLDGIILGVLTSIVALPWVRQVSDAYGRLIDEVLAAAEQGSGEVPGQAEFIAEIAGPLFTISIIALVISLVYNVIFLRWKAATPGKLALGLRIRLRETPGPLSFATIAKRWVAQNAYAVLSYVPVLGFLAGLYYLLDHLWPVWDSRRQALHDKLAATNVVRHRG